MSGSFSRLMLITAISICYSFTSFSQTSPNWDGAWSAADTAFYGKSGNTWKLSARKGFDVSSFKATKFYMSSRIPGFWEYLPNDYQTNTSKTYPLVIYFPGCGETNGGTAYLKLNGELVYRYGLGRLFFDENKFLYPGDPSTSWFNPYDSMTFPSLPTILRDNGNYFSNVPQKTIGQVYPWGGPKEQVIVLCLAYNANPQLPCAGVQEVYPEDIDAAIARAFELYRIDPTRVYMTGMSQGAKSSWFYPASSVANAKKIAASAPVGSVHAVGDIINGGAANIAAGGTRILCMVNRYDLNTNGSGTNAFLINMQSEQAVNNIAPNRVILDTFYSQWQVSPPHSPSNPATIHNGWGRAYRTDTYESPFIDNTASTPQRYTLIEWFLTNKSGSAGGSCGAPSGLSSTSITISSAQLNWSAVAGAVSYDVEYKTTAAVTWTPAVSGTTGTAYNLTGLNQGTQYNWRVRANCGTNGFGIYTAAEFTTTGTPSCTAPAGLTTSTITVSSAQLSWSAANGAVSYDVEYKVSTSVTWIVAAAGTTGTAYSLSGLAESTNYNWRVKTNCASGGSNYTNAQFTTISTTPVGNCPTPAGLTSGSITQTAAQLSWSWVGASNYTLEYKAAGSETWLVASSSIQGSSYGLYNLSAGTTYDWRLRSNCGANGSSVYVAAQFATLPCNAPTNITSTNINNTSAQLSWTAVAGSSNYAVEYKAAAVSTWIVASNAVWGTGYNLSGLQSGTLYDWRVRSNCGTSGTSVFTSAQFNTTGGASACNPPSGLLAGSITVSSAQLSWSAAANAVSYNVEYKTNISASWITAIAGTSATTFSLNGLAAATVYDWRVRTSCSAAGSSGYSVAQFTTASNNPPSGNCTAPGSLNSGNITISSAQFSWTWVGAASYTFEYKAATSANWIVASTTIQAASYSLYNLLPGTTYDYRVRSNCGVNGSSVYVNTQFTTLACPAPSNLNAGSLTNTSAQLSWSWVGGSGYTVEYKTTVAVNWIVATASSPGTSYYLTGLTGGTAYNWRVKTNCGSGSSLFSAAQFTTTGALNTGNISQQGMLMETTGWKVFPVPARNYVNFSFSSSSAGKAQVIITDISGRTLKSEAIQVIGGFNNMRLDLNGILPGVYFLRMTGKDHSQVSKIIIQ